MAIINNAFFPGKKATDDIRSAVGGYATSATGSITQNTILYGGSQHTKNYVNIITSTKSESKTGSFAPAVRMKMPLDVYASTISTTAVSEEVFYFEPGYWYEIIIPKFYAGTTGSGITAKTSSAITIKKYRCGENSLIDTVYSSNYVRGFGTGMSTSSLSLRLYFA